MENCLFCKIIAGEIPATKMYEDENMIIIKDILIAEFILLTEFVKLCRCAPPIIVITFQNNLFSRNFINPGKVQRCLL